MLVTFMAKNWKSVCGGWERRDDVTQFSRNLSSCIYNIIFLCFNEDGQACGTINGSEEGAGLYVKVAADTTKDPAACCLSRPAPAIKKLWNDEVSTEHVT
jgi:hypothetical protein